MSGYENQPLPQVGKNTRGVARARARAVRVDPEPDGGSVWSSVITGRPEIMGGRLANGGEPENSQRYRELVQRAHLDDRTVYRFMVVPKSFVFGTPNQHAANSAHGVDIMRSVDAIQNSTEVGRSMPPLAVALTFSVFILLVNPDDYIGEIKGILAVLVPLGLYWLSQRAKRKARQDAESHRTTDAIYRASSDKEKRLEERETRLREEERDFFQRQMELSRERGHILARGYMAMELANDQLIQLLNENDIEIPPILLTQKTRAQVLGELKIVEEKQAENEK